MNRDKVQELFELSDEKLAEAKRLMAQAQRSEDSDQGELQTRIRQLIAEANKLSKLAEELSANKYSAL